MEVLFSVDERTVVNKSVRPPRQLVDTTISPTNVDESLCLRNVRQCLVLIRRPFAEVILQKILLKLLILLTALDWIGRIFKSMHLSI